MTATARNAKMSNATARQHYLHDCDQDEQGRQSCYFSERAYDESGWGFWVSPAGEVTTDDTSANGEMPAPKIIAACVRAAKKHLAR